MLWSAKRAVRSILSDDRSVSRFVGTSVGGLVRFPSANTVLACYCRSVRCCVILQQTCRSASIVGRWVLSSVDKSVVRSLSSVGRSVGRCVIRRQTGCRLCLERKGRSVKVLSVGASCPLWVKLPYGRYYRAAGRSFDPSVG